MPFTLDPSKLELGDIILTRNKKGIKSWVIRIFTASPFSHAALYVGGNSYMEALGCGVHAQNIFRGTFRKKTDVIVLRKPGMTPDEKQRVVEFVRYRHGMAYSVPDAIKSGLSVILGVKIPFRMKENQTFCSQLVASAYEGIGIESFNGRKALFVRPKDIYKEKRFSRIDDVYREITDDEKDVAAQKGLIDIQDEIVSSMMAQIWKVLKKEGVFIKGVSEIDFGISMIANQRRKADADEQIEQIIQKSGYLDMWKFDMDKCPENYSMSELKKAHPNASLRELAARASDKVMMWDGFINLRLINISAAEENYNQLRLKTSKLLLDLEKTLLANAQKARDEFDTFLRTLWSKGLTPQVLNNICKE